MMLRYILEYNSYNHIMSIFTIKGWKKEQLFSRGIIFYMSLNGWRTKVDQKKLMLSYGISWWVSSNNSIRIKMLWKQRSQFCTDLNTVQTNNIHKHIININIRDINMVIDITNMRVTHFTIQFHSWYWIHI